ncbi:MAG: hypothetical protein ACYC2H_02220 [Thermoplasmatota archaeon]
MRSALFLLVLLGSAALAGCSGPEAAQQSVALASEPETFSEEPVVFDVQSSLWVCGAFGCAGANGDTGVAFGEKTYTGFKLEVKPSEDPAGLGTEPPGVPGAEIRIIAKCAGDSRTCPAGILAETVGPWPATLEASGFRITDPDLLMFKVEYLGPYPPPVTGSGQGFDFEGTLTFVEGSEVDAEDSDEGADA